MFLSLNKKDFSWARSKKAIPVFLLLWFGGILLAIMYLVAFKSHLSTVERQETEKLLTDYLKANQAAQIYSGLLRIRDSHPLQGLTFVRLIRGTEHVILINEDSKHPTYSGLVDLPYEKTGIWLTIGSGEDERVLSVVTRKFDNGVLVQAGKNGEERYTLYKSLVHQTVWGVVGSILILWPLALYYIKLSLAPLTFTRRKIAELANKPKSGLLPEENNGPELDSLYRQINRIIKQNRHLVSEMQDSLDNVAHDLRTPMTRLRSVAEYGLQAEDDTEKLRESLSDCLEESERVLAMLKIMMSVAEAESGTMRLELEDYEVGATLKEIITLYEYVAEEKQVSVEFVLMDEVTTRIDHIRISQVWANLLDNGIKYGREGGWVKISLEKDGGNCVVTFEDNGIGISENELGRIWDRLYRGDRSRSQKGLGLGLNYVKAVLVAHGGTVSVQSGLNQGSIFEVRIPLAHSSV